jgi:hypothetical protein
MRYKQLAINILNKSLETDIVQIIFSLFFFILVYSSKTGFLTVASCKFGCLPPFRYVAHKRYDVCLV